MTDQQIIEALIARNERVTQQFFFGNCRPLFLNIIRFVFSYEVDYDEFIEDMIYGHNPNHAVTILNYDKENESITILDPDSTNPEYVYTTTQFLNEWADSKNYLITINTKR